MTLPFERVIAEADEVPDAERTGKRGEVLSPIRESILDLMRDNPNITQKRLAEELGFGHTSHTYNIGWLRDNGYVIREGSRKSGWWRVL